jgi:hypothetical protein
VLCDIFVQLPHAASKMIDLDDQTTIETFWLASLNQLAHHAYIDLPALVHEVLGNRGIQVIIDRYRCALVSHPILPC